MTSGWWHWRREWRVLNRSWNTNFKIWPVWSYLCQNQGRRFCTGILLGFPAGSVERPLRGRRSDGGICHDSGCGMQSRIQDYRWRLLSSQNRLRRSRRHVDRARRGLQRFGRGLHFPQLKPYYKFFLCKDNLKLFTSFRVFRNLNVFLLWAFWRCSLDFSERSDGVWSLPPDSCWWNLKVCRIAFCRVKTWFFKNNFGSEAVWVFCCRLIWIMGTKRKIF